MSTFDPASMPPSVPIPVQALPYSIPVQYGRPGIITAIGVICIVVACLSGITSFATGVYSSLFYMMSKMSTMVAQQSVAANATRAVAPQTAAPPGKMSPSDVGVALNSLQIKLQLDAAHVRELDRLLRLHGREIIEDDDAALTSASVNNAVSASQPQVGNSPARFKTNRGTVLIYPDRTKFTSADGSVKIATSVKHQSDQRSFFSTSSSTSYSFQTSNGAALSPAQVASVVAAVTAINSTLNPSQLASLQTELAKPNQMLVMPATAVPGGRPVISSYAPPGGNAVIMFATGSQLVLGPGGQVISSGPPAFPKFKVSGALVVILVAEAILSVALAIYLLIVGIQVFRASFRAPRLLSIYAWLKIPLALVAGVGLAMLGYQFTSGITNMAQFRGATPNTAGISLGFIFWGCVIAGLGLALPIGLLIALRSRTVKDYYNSVTPGN